MNRKAVARELVKVARDLLGSTIRYCAFYKAKDDKWYMDLAKEKYGERYDATTYGPFGSEDETEDFLYDNFSNPGSRFVDDSGKKPAPTLSPNDEPVVNPKHFRRGM